jgi:hypothetical protein
MMSLMLILLREGGGQMSIGFVFWLLMLLWLILGFVWYWPRGTPTAYPMVGGHVLIFVLFFILGWATFGFPIGG